MQDKSIDMTLFEAAKAKLIGPYLERLSLDRFNEFIRLWQHRANREERFGQYYLRIYGMFGYTNNELYYASNSKAFVMLNNFTRIGDLNGTTQLATGTTH